MLKETERVILNAIELFWTNNGHSPSITELEKETYYSRNVVRNAIKQLKKKGYLEVEKEVRRSIKPRNMVNIMKNVRESICNKNQTVSPEALMDMLIILQNDLSKGKYHKKDII